MKLGVLLVVLFSINTLWALLFGGAHIGQFLFYTAMIAWGTVRIVQAKRRKVGDEARPVKKDQGLPREGSAENL